MPLLTSLYWLSLNCYHEARGEPRLGQMYVSAVVMNRAEDSKKSIKEIVNEPSQFSWVNAEVGQRPVSDIRIFLQCAETAIEAANSPISKELLYYHKTSVKPYWARTLKPVVTIGNHIFYKRKRQ